MKAVEALALVGGHVSEEILKRNEYLAAENEILRSRIKGRVELTDGERIRLAKLGHALGRTALEGVAAIVKPETILEWFRRLVASMYDGAKSRKRAGRPRTPEEIEKPIVRLAEESRGWGTPESSARCRTSASSDAKRRSPRSLRGTGCQRPVNG